MSYVRGLPALSGPMRALLSLLTALGQTPQTVSFGELKPDAEPAEPRPAAPAENDPFDVDEVTRA